MDLKQRIQELIKKGYKPSIATTLALRELEKGKKKNGKSTKR